MLACWDNHTVSGEIEEVGQILQSTIGMPRVRKAAIGMAKLVEELVAHRLDR